jgi:cob(I)alamin adenosyltransferase
LLKQDLEKSIDKQAAMATVIAAMQAQLGQMQEELQACTETLTEMPGREAAKTLEQDVRSIRENLGEIRSFIHAVSKKL